MSAKIGASRIETGAARQHRRQIEAEPVDAQRARNGAGCRASASRTSARAKSSVLPVPVSLISAPSARVARNRAASSSPRSDSVGPAHVALAGVVEDQVEDHADPRRAQRRDRIAPARRPRRAPAAGRAPSARPGCSPTRWSSPSGGRWRSSIQATIGISSTAATRSVRRCAMIAGCASAAIVPALFLGHVGVAHREAADVEFVDQPARLERRRGRRGGACGPRVRSPAAPARRCRRPASPSRGS